MKKKQPKSMGWRIEYYKKFTLNQLREEISWINGQLGCADNIVMHIQKLRITYGFGEELSDITGSCSERLEDFLIYGDYKLNELDELVSEKEKRQKKSGRSK